MGFRFSREIKQIMEVSFMLLWLFMEEELLIWFLKEGEMINFVEGLNEI